MSITTPEEFRATRIHQQGGKVNEERKHSGGQSKPPWEIPLEDPHTIKVDAPSTWAGGIPAILTSLKHTTHEMGLIRGGQALLKLNQKEGFD